MLRLSQKKSSLLSAVMVFFFFDHIDFSLRNVELSSLTPGLACIYRIQDSGY